MRELKVGSRIMTIRPFGICYYPGYVCTIIGFTENGAMNIDPGYGINYITEDELDKYFVQLREWTHWINISDDTFEPSEIGTCKMRTDNEKYVEIRCGSFYARASCHPNDEFDLFTGIAIAMSKIEGKKRKIDEQNDRFVKTRERRKQRYLRENT